MSLFKNLQPLTRARPRPVIAWDKCERIQRNKEIWDDPNSVVHRLPLHYQKRYWQNVLSDAAPVHYEPPQCSLMWDPKRRVEVPLEVSVCFRGRTVQDYPIRPIPTPEMHAGLWAGEGLVKGYVESKPFVKKKILPRHWVPRFFFPNALDCVLYSEVLDKYMKVSVTQRAMQLIDEAFGLDLYLLTTPEIDVNSKLGMRLKRAILVSLAKEDYHPDDRERHEYIKEKYAPHRLPLEEAEWVGLELNEAAEKLQRLELNSAPLPDKYVFERALVDRLARGEDVQEPEDDTAPKKTKSLFGERMFGQFMKPLEERVRR